MPNLKINITPEALRHPKMKLNFIDLWLQTNADEASPTIYHRWVAMMTISTMLKRNIYVNFHNTPLSPNMYALLVGIPATRKTSAAMKGKEFLTNLGYPAFAPSTIDAKDWPYLFTAAYKESLRDSGYVPSLVEDTFDEALKSSALDKVLRKETASAKVNLLGANVRLDVELEELLETPPEERVNELGIWSLEFADCLSTNQPKLIASLTEMYDTHTLQRHRFDRSAYTQFPVVNLLGCIAPATLASQFDPKSWEGGFLTRTILVHGEPTHTTPNMFNAPINPMLTSILMYKGAQIRNLKGEVTVSKKAQGMFHKITELQPKLKDIRLQAYLGRRLTHLLKLSMVRAAGDIRTNVTEDDVTWANTVLTYTELNMSKALGDFGSTPQVKLRNSTISILSASDRPLSAQDLESKLSQKTGETSNHKLARAIADLVNDGTILRLKTGSVSLYSIPKAGYNKILDLDGVILKTDAMVEWASLLHTQDM